MMLHRYAEDITEEESVYLIKPYGKDRLIVLEKEYGGEEWHLGNSNHECVEIRFLPKELIEHSRDAGHEVLHVTALKPGNAVIHILKGKDKEPPTKTLTFIISIDDERKIWICTIDEMFRSLFSSY